MTSHEQAITNLSDIPICFPLPDSYTPANPEPIAASGSRKQHKLHGADDLITLFKLHPLWDRSAKPFTQTNKNQLKQKEDGLNEIKVKEENVEESNEEKVKVMEKTYIDYVRDLPGKVRPQRKTLNKFVSASSKANELGQIPPNIPVELTGRTTMKDIVWRPETTIQRVGPFDEELLRAAFTVEAGNLTDIDLTLLESDELEKQSPTKKRKKRRHPTRNDQPEDANAAKRSKLNNFASSMSNSK